MKRILAMALAVLMLATAPAEILASNATKSVDTSSAKTAKVSEAMVGGYMQPEAIEVTESFKAADLEIPEEDVATNLYTAKKSEWYDYATFYVYNQLSAAEKKAWNKMDSLCYKLLTTKNNASYNIGMVSCGDMSANEAIYFGLIFRLCNPQYYFLNNRTWYGYQGGDMHIGIGVYEKFQSGSARNTATKKVKSQVTSWKNKAAKKKTEAEQVLLLHDLIVKKVDYNYGILADGQITVYEEEQAFTQSAYSVFCTDLTVCAGYAEAMQMMCNAMDIDTMCVTSYNHQWNKVRINDSWFNIDPTWADQGNIYYEFYARSNDYYYSASQASSHMEESYWDKYLPKCTLNATFKNGYWSAPTLPKITATTKEPTVTFKSAGNGKYTITIKNNTKGAKVYYTTDGSTPSPGRTESSIYKKAFKVDKGKTVKAIAVCNAKKDSKVVVKKLGANTTYTIKFNANGGKGSMSALKNRKYLSTYTLPANKYTRKGYTFKGWNTKKDGKGTSYANKEKVQGLTEKKNGTVTLYAQWEKTKYTITYKLNSGKNNSSNPATYTITTATINLKNPTRAGYTFKGWYKESNFKTKVTQIKKGSTGNKTFYAKWSANKYNIAFDGNGATAGTMPNQTGVTYGKNVKLAPNTFTKVGYVFDGWCTDPDGEGTIYADEAQVKNLAKKNGETVTLYAQWSLETYTITYELNGGVESYYGPSLYTIETETITFYNAWHTGNYSFGGWYLDPNLTNKITELPKGSTGNITLYAKWIPW